MRVDERFLGWGVFFILLGAVPLAVQAGIVDEDVVSRAWQLWPLFIVAAGAGLLLRHTAFHWVGGLLAGATFGLIFGSLLAVGANFAGSCGSGNGTAFTQQQGQVGPNATVGVDFTCGELAIATATGSAWTLNGTSDGAAAPRVDANGTSLQVRSPNRSFGFFGFGSRQSWSLMLPQDPTIDLDVTMNAAAGQLTLGGAHLGRFDVTGNATSSVIDLGSVAGLRTISVTFNAGSPKITFPNASVAGSLQVNAGSISFCVPEGVGIRIETSQNVTASNNFGSAGLTQAGNVWQSANYAAAANHIDLSANANAGSLNLNPREGCR